VNPSPFQKNFSPQLAWAAFPLVSCALALGIALSCGTQDTQINNKTSAKDSSKVSPKPSGSAGTGTGGVTAFTFAEAKATCGSCHGPSSGYHWNGADNENGWVTKLTNIRARVEKNDMPPKTNTAVAGISAEARAKMLAFLDTLKSKTPTPTPTPGASASPTASPAPATAFTLTEAEAKCSGCHASGANNVAAKNAWTFTIGTIGTWSGQKTNIASAAANGYMPPGAPLNATDKARFASFLLTVP
jgi:hypothetical protein